MKKSVFLNLLVSLFFITGCQLSYKLNYDVSLIYGTRKYPRWADLLDYPNLDDSFFRYIDKKLFFSLDDLLIYFNDSNYFKYETNNDYLKDRIENEVDFNKFNLLVTCRYEGTGSYVHFANVDGYKVNIYSYCGEVVTDDIAFKSLIIPVKKEYNLDEIEVKYHYEVLKAEDISNICKTYGNKYYY